MRNEIQPELSGQVGQMRIDKDIAISRHIAQFWSERMGNGTRQQLSERERLIYDKKAAIWDMQREREESATGVIKVEEIAERLAQGEKVPVITHAKPWIKDTRTLLVDGDGNLYENRLVEHVKMAGTDKWKMRKKKAK